MPTPSNGYFSADALVHQAPHLFRVVVVRLQEHQLGDGALHRRVVAAHDACLLQLEARVVAVHLHTALHALADVDDYLAVACPFLQGAEQPRVLRSVARAEGPHDDGLQVGRVDDVADEVLADAREEREDDDVVVQAEVGFHGAVPVGPEDAFAVVDDVHAGIHKMGVVERLEGIELVGTLLGGAVATQQVSVEEDAHFRHPGVPLAVPGRGYLDGSDEVFLAVGAELADGELAACEDDGFGQVLHHVRKSRGGVGHRVGAVQHDEAVELVVAVGYHVAQPRPVLWRHVAAVDWRLELTGLYVCVQQLQFGNILQESVEVEGLQRPGVRVAVHADGPAGVYQQHFCLVRHSRVREFSAKVQQISES